MTQPTVTIIVVPRERFSYTYQSLESIYEHTEYPFELVYVDGGSPAATRRYLETQAQAKGFKLIRSDRYLPPNHARNLGLREVNSQYVVFIDNDVVVTPGWLRKLVECAEETNATVISPLICQEEPAHEIIHCAGGEARIIETNQDGVQRKRIHEKIYRQGQRLDQVGHLIKRGPTEMAEFHCMLVRSSFLEQLGGTLDAGLLNTREHVDFCISVLTSGGSIHLEPDSIVTYVPGPPLTLSDIPFFMLRWSDAWEMASLHHLRDKWDLTEDQFFKNRYNRLGWRRHLTVVKPLAFQLGLNKRRQRLENWLKSLDKKLNRYLTDRYAKRHANELAQVQPHQAPSKSTEMATSAAR